jgi:hypothetical protein
MRIIAARKKKSIKTNPVFAEELTDEFANANWQSNVNSIIMENLIQHLKSQFEKKTGTYNILMSAVRPWP